MLTTPTLLAPADAATAAAKLLFHVQVKHCSCNLQYLFDAKCQSIKFKESRILSLTTFSVVVSAR